MLITEYEKEIATKEGWLGELKQKLALREQEERGRHSGGDLQALKNHFQNEKDSIVQAYENHIEALQKQAEEELQAL